ncbi:MAG: HpcH/HpaI aldolase/citrate lyase family protein [Deltaproteobacteria bacterium]|nr:HpcH/HpaI aldolase/citrate lyase family protein [Deltaproteobacteria bacterium]
MNDTIVAGNKGPKVRGDCFITFDPKQNRRLEIRVESSVIALFGEAIRLLAERVLYFFGIEQGQVHIKDSGALDFVIAARIEACVKQLVTTDKNYLPDMIPENRYASSKKRVRMSRLYLPGNTPKMMINAGIHHPHAVILDLEDAVAVAKKDEARLLVRNALRQVDFCGAERMVRINQLPLGLTDLEQVVPQGVHVLLIPKCESCDEIKQVNEKINRIKETTAMAHDIFLMPIIESSKGVLNAIEIAGAAENIVALAIGLEDYTADLGVKRTFEGTESFYARSHLVSVCKAYGIQAIDSVFSDVGDSEGLKQTVARSKSLGFEGMGCIHPRQIPIIHDGYAPDAQEIEIAKRIVKAFERATEEGLGVVSLGTKMIDPPVAERALQTISLAVSLNKISEDWRSEDE